MQLFLMLFAAAIGCTCSIVLEEPIEDLAIACPKDRRYCLDGTVLVRDPNNNCRFPKCPTPCPEDVKPCPDDLPWVIRNPNDPHCRFYQCEDTCPPGSSRVDSEFGICGGIAGFQCPSGSYCEYGYQPGIVDAAGWCCELIACTKDAKTCPDGTVVGRDHLNNCEWFPCPGECPDGGTASGSCGLRKMCGREEVCVYSTAVVTVETKGWCCPSCFWAEICKYEDHIWKDYFRFLQKHKRLVEITGNKAKWRKLFDQIYEKINCINDLICKVKEKKEKIKNGDVDRNGIAMVRCLWDWMQQIMEKADEIEALVKKLKGMLNKDNQQAVLQEIDDLKGKCLVAAFDSPQKLAFDVGHAIMMTLIPVEANSILDASVICQKAEELGLLFHMLLNDLGTIYGNSMSIFLGNLKPGLIPAFWFNDLTKCIYDLAILYYEIRECCGKIANGEVTIAELVKKLGAWLKKAMDLREKLRKCMDKKIATTLKKAILQINGTDPLIVESAENAETDVTRRVKGIMKRFDDCIIKLRCEFLKLVDQFWQP